MRRNKGDPKFLTIVTEISGNPSLSILNVSKYMFLVRLLFKKAVPEAGFCRQRPVANVFMFHVLFIASQPRKHADIELHSADEPSAISPSLLSVISLTVASTAEGRGMGTGNRQSNGQIAPRHRTFCQTPEHETRIKTAIMFISLLFV